MGSLPASHIVGGNSTMDRRKNDFYPTPPEVVTALLDFLHLPENTVIWEPAAGEGDMLETINADAVFFSCRGVSADGRMTDSSVEECELRKLMFRHAKRRVLMAAHNKIGRDYFYVQGHVSEIDDIVSDGPLPACFSQPGADGRAPQIHIG